MGNPSVFNQEFNPFTSTIPSNYARLIARELELQASELDQLLFETGLTPDEFMQEDTLLNMIQLEKITENALRISEDEALGFRVGHRITLPTHGAIGFLASSSPNLYKALEAFSTYFPSRVGFLNIELIDNKEWVDVYIRLNLLGRGNVAHAITEAVIVLLFECADFILGRPLVESITTIDYSEPNRSLPYSNFIPGDIVFDSSELMIKIPKHLCYLLNNSTNHENYMFAMQQCETMAAHLKESKESYKYKVQRLMLSLPPGTLTEEEAAARLFMSKRTLARKLKSEETGFREIREKILSQQAIDYLCNSNMTTDEIAALLNYHDSANFRRAFKRWFLMNPDMYRKKYGSKEQSKES